MLNPLYFAVSWVLLRWHALWASAFGDTSGVTWALSIAFLVMTIRLILFPLFVKQIHSQRAMQDLQPRLKELQKKHKGDKETLQREMMALYKEHGANPVAGCLPIVLQAPVFLALFHVLRRLNPHAGHATQLLYGWTSEQFLSASQAKLFGAPIAAHFNMSAADLAKLSPDASTTTVKLVTGVLIAIMVATTYITQRQMISRQASSGQAVDQQQQMVQRLMLYGVPVSLLVSGSLFPLGVVIYWCTTNLWSMGQQFYVLRKMPHPGGKPEPKADPEVATAAARALAPRPGARPAVAKKSGPGPLIATSRPNRGAIAGQQSGKRPATTPTRTPARPNKSQQTPEQKTASTASANPGSPLQGPPAQGSPVKPAAQPSRHIPTRAPQTSATPDSDPAGAPRKPKRR